MQKHRGPLYLSFYPQLLDPSFLVHIGKGELKTMMRRTCFLLMALRRTYLSHFKGKETNGKERGGETTA